MASGLSVAEVTVWSRSLRGSQGSGHRERAECVRGREGSKASRYIGRVRCSTEAWVVAHLSKVCGLYYHVGSEDIHTVFLADAWIDFLSC